MMADPVIRAAFKLPAAAAVVAATDHLGRCCDLITALHFSQTRLIVTRVSAGDMYKMSQKSIDSFHC